MCRLAKSQNAKPILFLDGDKYNEIEKVRIKHPEIPIVTLDKDTEFEEIIPMESYIQAAAEVLEDTSGNINLDNYLAWEKKANLRASIMFSKRVDRWLCDEHEKPLYKTRVMLKAIELTEIDKIKTETFERLFKEMLKVSD